MKYVWKNEDGSTLIVSEKCPEENCWFKMGEVKDEVPNSTVKSKDKDKSEFQSYIDL
jgi:hypothetical protein